MHLDIVSLLLTDMVIAFIIVSLRRFFILKRSLYLFRVYIYVYI